jgi:hypothetical protein
VACHTPSVRTTATKEQSPLLRAALFAAAQAAIEILCRIAFLIASKNQEARQAYRNTGT